MAENTAASTVMGEDSKTTADNGAPPPDVDVTQTAQWISGTQPDLLTPGDTVTHNNLEVIASVLQGITMMQLGHAEQLRKITSILEKEGRFDTSSGSSSTKRRRLPSYAGEPMDTAGDASRPLAEDKHRDRGSDKVIDDLSMLDGFYKSFVLAIWDSHMAKLPEYCSEQSKAFLAMAKQQLGDCIGEADAKAINARVSDMNMSQLLVLQNDLAGRYVANK